MVTTRLRWQHLSDSDLNAICQIHIFDGFRSQCPPLRRTPTEYFDLFKVWTSRCQVYTVLVHFIFPNPIYKMLYKMHFDLSSGSSCELAVIWWRFGCDLMAIRLRSSGLLTTTASLSKFKYFHCKGRLPGHTLWVCSARLWWVLAHSGDLAGAIFLGPLDSGFDFNRFFLSELTRTSTNRIPATRTFRLGKRSYWSMSQWPWSLEAARVTPNRLYSLQ